MKKYDNFCKALDNLKQADVIKTPYTIVEQTGIVALFAICFEQSWKLMKELLEKHGRVLQKTGSPRLIIKLAFECGMISDEDGWLNILESRNLLTHTYSEKDALTAIEQIKKSYLPLFENLKTEIDENWMIGEDGNEI